MTTIYLWFLGISAFIMVAGLFCTYFLNNRSPSIYKYIVFFSLYFSIIFPGAQLLFYLIIRNLNFHDSYILANGIGIDIGLYYMFFPILIFLYLIGNIIRFLKYKEKTYKYLIIFLLIFGLISSAVSFHLWMNPWID